MLFQPKKPKYTKSFSNKKSTTKAIKKILSPRFGNFSVVAAEQGFLSNFQMEAFRRVLRRSFKKRGQIFFRVFPQVPITKKPIEIRLGRGKGSLKY